MSAGGFSYQLRLVQEEDWTQDFREPTRYRAGHRPFLLGLVFINESHLIDGYKLVSLVERVTTLCKNSVTSATRCVRWFR